MWRRKDDLEYNNNNYDNEEKPKKHTCLIIYCVIYVLMIIAAALLIYFLFPREPTIQQNGIHVNYFSLNSSYMRINATAYVNITNPNYVSIILKSANIKISYDGTILGNIVENNINFSPRSTTTTPIPISLESSSSVVQSMYSQYEKDQYVTLTFDGPVTVSYLTVSITRNIDITQNVKKT